MKTVSAGMTSHLQQEVTTLATCWEMKRTDGKFFRFTDNVRNLVVDNATYRADAGYTRSALSNTSDFAVDNLDVDGFYEADSITETDLRAGKFDFAEVRIFLVNYLDTTQILKMRRGSLGEVQSYTAERFRAELRSLAQKLQQQLGELTQADCRADVGDKQCTFPIQPPVMLRNTAYALGEFLRVYTAVGATVLTVPVADADFEALTGWTTIDGDPEIVASYDSITPFEGSNFLHGNSSSSPDGFVIRQDVDITAIGGYDQGDLDAGFYAFRASIRQINTGSTRDAGRVRVEALDENGEVLQELWNTKYEILDPRRSWELKAVSDVVLPAGTNTLRFWVEGGNYAASGVTEVGFDDLAAEIVDSGVTGTQAAYENKIYECTTAGTTAGSQPTYDETVGNTTADGTAVFTARQAFMRHAVVASVTSNQVFSITWTAHPDNADDWLNGGAVIWETGNNKDQAMEIKDWTASGATVSLFLEMPNTIQVGDKLRLFPGCDKKRSGNCRLKFVIPGSQDYANGNVKNIDSEPDLPGPDFILTYPDAD